MLGLSEDDWDTMGKNVKSNFNKTTSDIRSGNLLSGYLDAKNFINNPVANNSNANIQAPTLKPEHLGEPDENGFQKINDTGLQHLQSNAIQVPDESQPKVSKGLVGNLLGQAGGGMIAGLI